MRVKVNFWACLDYGIAKYHADCYDTATKNLLFELSSSSRENLYTQLGNALKNLVKIEEFSHTAYYNIDEAGDFSCE